MKKLFFIFVTVFSFSNNALPQTLVMSDTGVRFISPNDSTDIEKINFLGEKSRIFYVPAILAEGKKVKVPVVNNIIPILELHAFDDGSYLRIYHYDKKNKYNGEDLLKFKILDEKATLFKLSPSLNSEKVMFQENTPVTGVVN